MEGGVREIETCDDHLGTQIPERDMVEQCTRVRKIETCARFAV